MEDIRVFSTRCERFRSIVSSNLPSLLTELAVCDVCDNELTAVRARAAASSSESSCASLQRQYGARYDAWRLSTDWCDRRRKIESRRSNHRCKHCVRAAGQVGLNV